MLLTPKALQPYAFTVRLPHKDENLTILKTKNRNICIFQSTQKSEVHLLENQSNIYSEEDSLFDREGWVPVMAIYF